MKVIDYEEHRDGSATIQIALEYDECRRLVEIGMLTAIKNFIAEEEDGDEECDM